MSSQPLANPISDRLIHITTPATENTGKKYWRSLRRARRYGGGFVNGCRRNFRAERKCFPAPRAETF